MRAFSLLAVPLLASAAPTLNTRAGAPVKQPLPADCGLTRAFPSPNTTAFMPTESFGSAHMLYEYSLSPGATQPDGTVDSKAVSDCLETCYAFGNPGQCKSVWTAHGSYVNTYGTKSYAEFVCRIYGQNITSEDLGPQLNGEEDAQAHAIMVSCARPE